MMRENKRERGADWNKREKNELKRVNLVKQEEAKVPGEMCVAKESESFREFLYSIMLDQFKLVLRIWCSFKLNVKSL